MDFGSDFDRVLGSILGICRAPLIFHTCISEAADSYRTDNQVAGQQTVPSVPFLHGYFTCAAKVARHDGDAITALATALLAVITLMLVFLGIEQSKTTRAQLRAYLSVVIGDAIYQDKALRFEGLPTLRNNGQTPAYKVRVCVAADIIADANLETYDFSKAAPLDLGESQACISSSQYPPTAHLAQSSSNGLRPAFARAPPRFASSFKFASAGVRMMEATAGRCGTVFSGINLAAQLEYRGYAERFEFVAFRETITGLCTLLPSAPGSGRKAASQADLELRRQNIFQQ